MVNTEIIIGLIAIGVLGAIFIPLAFDGSVGGVDFIDCEQNEIIKYSLVNGTLAWVCATDETGSTEIVVGTYANENTEFRPHLVQGTNIQDPIKNFGEYSIRVLEFLSDEFGEVSWDYLVPQDYELGEDLEFIVYWFKEDGLADSSIVPHYNEQSTACQNTSTSATPLNVMDGIEFDFEEGEDYLILVNTGWGNDENHAGVSVLEVLHGSTVFEGSRQAHVLHNDSPLPCGVDEELAKYFWWTLWQPNATEATEDISFRVDNNDNLDFAIQLGGVGAILYDDTTISILKLSDNFVEDVDYFHNLNNTKADILNSWATGNGEATITFTPETDDNDWLVLGTNLNNQTSKDYGYQTRLLTSGSQSDTFPNLFRQGEAQTTNDFGVDAFENDMSSFSRVFTIDNSTSTTFTVQTQVEDGETNPDPDQPVPDQRLSNSIFAINLSKFSQHAFEWNRDDVNLAGNNDFGEILATGVLNATTDDKNVFIIAQTVVEDPNPNIRTQMDQVDILPDETFQSYNWNDDISNDDFYAWTLTTITDPVLSGIHTFDLDAGKSQGKGSQFVEQSSLAVVILEAEPLTPTIETVCMEVRLMSVDIGEDLSSSVVPTHTPYKEVCSGTVGGADILRTFVFNFNATENPFEPEEVGILQLKRHSDNSTSDNYNGKVFALFGELQWIVVP